MLTINMAAKPTSLARQLQKLALPESNFGTFKSSLRQSLLFDSKVAGSLDKDTFYALGLNGFQELCGLDSSFYGLYFETLFSEVAADTERTLKSKEFNQNLDSQIDSFLLMLSPYLLLRPAKKCIEWLVYRFRIHLFNVDSLMKCAFPYYKTNFFISLVQLLDGKQKSHEKWLWLIKAQDDGTSISLNNVIHYCSSNIWFLDFICKALLKSVKIHEAHLGEWQIRNLLNLFTSSVLGLMYFTKSVTEKFLILIMPVVIKGIKSKLLDFQASSFMIISQLVVKETFNFNSLDLIVNSTAKHCLPQLHKQALQMLSLLCHNQEKLNHLNERSFLRFLEWNDLLETLVELTSINKSDQFLLLFFQCLIPKVFLSTESENCNSTISDDNLWKENENYQLFFQSIVECAKLSKYLQLHVYKLLILNSSKFQEKTTDVLKNIIYKMQKKYSETFDIVIAEALNSAEVSNEVIQKFLAFSLASAKHQLVGDSSVPLAFAISHPNPSVRQLAIQKLRTVLSAKNSSEETKLFAVNALKTILTSNEKPTVIVEAVQVVFDFFTIFLDQHGGIPAKLINIIEEKWNDSSWNVAVKLCVKCLVKNCTAFGEFINSPQEILLTNKTVLIVIKLLLESACNSKSGPSVTFLKEIASFSICTKNAILSNLLHGEKTITTLQKRFVKTQSNENTYVDISNLLNAILNFVDNKFYSSVLLFLLNSSININNKNKVLKNLDYLLKATHLLWTCGKDFVIIGDGCTDLLKKLILVRDADTSNHVNCSLLLHIWKDVIYDIVPKFQINYNKLLQCQEIKEICPTGVFSNIYRLLLDLMKYPTSKQTKIFIQELFSSFFKRMFNNSSEALLFVAIFAILPVLTNSEVGGAIAVTHSILSYHVANTLVCSGNLKTAMHDQHFVGKSSCFVVPSLLLACTSAKKSIRSAAVDVLKSLVHISRFLYEQLLNYLLKHYEEIILDSFHCSHALKCYFNVKSFNSKDKKIRATLLLDIIAHHVTKPLLEESYPDVAVKLYDQCFSEIENAALYQLIIPCLDKLLETYLISDKPKEAQCIMINFFLKKISSNNCTDKRKEVLFVKALKTGSKVLVNDLDCQLIPQLIALEQLQGSFFKSLGEQTQKEILTFLITIKSTSLIQEVSAAATKAFKAISIDSLLVVNKFKEWNLLSSGNDEKKNVIEVKRAKKQKIVNSLKVQPLWWKEFVVLLELLHHKKRIQQPENLIGPFFSVLMDVVEEKYAADNLDYVTLLLLGGLLNLLDRKSFETIKANKLKFNIKVELLVRCIHSTQNTQTHQHALMLLAKAAHFCPEKVLHSVMSIFTFMGSTLLRRDDVYSFQVITQTIRTVIPALMELDCKESGGLTKSSVLGILRVFVDSLPHIPAHRRLMVLEELLDTVGADVYLWQLMVLMADQHVCQHFRTPSNEDNDEIIHDDAATKMEESFILWTSISQLFPVKMRIKCIFDMINFLQTQLDHPSNNTELTGQSSILIDFSKRSTNQVHRFHVIMLTLSSYIIRSVKSSTEQRRDREESDFEVDDLLECILFYLGHVSKEVPAAESNDPNINETLIRYQKIIVRKVNDILEKINSLLSLHKFLQQVCSLLDSPLISERTVVLRKMIQLFQGRVSRSGTKFSDTERQILFKLSRRFLSMLRDGCEKETSNEASLHTAALGLTSIVRITCKTNPSAFVDIQPIICDVIKARTLSDNLLSVLLLCLSEVIVNLKAHSIVNLTKISSCLINLLTGHQVLHCDAALVSLLTTINKLFMCLGHFLSPYVEDFLAKLSVLSRMKYLSGGKASDLSTFKHVTKPASKRIKIVSASETPIHQLVANVLQLVLEKVASRVWIPILDRSFDKARANHPLAVYALVNVVSQSIEKLNKDELCQHSNKMMNFFLHAMQFRSYHCKMSLEEINGIETLLLNGVITLLVKLPETIFRPLYMKLFDWGCSAEVSVVRAVTFYHCTSLMAARLKGLFEIFATDLLEDLCRELEICPLLSEHTGREETEISLKMTYVLRTLGLMLSYSSSNLLNQNKFEMIFKPLLRQIEVEFSNREKSEDYFSNHVIVCVRHLSGAIHGNISWQPYNHCILMKTRNSSPHVRCHALECLKVTVEELGEDYLTQLPESIPFLTELLEDEFDQVEKCCHKVIKHMEDVLGEPLQRYF